MANNYVELVGQTVANARPMTNTEMEAEGWESCGCYIRPVCIIFNDGTKIFPASDKEGNDGGCMFGVAPDGQKFCLH